MTLPWPGRRVPAPIALYCLCVLLLLWPVQMARSETTTIQVWVSVDSPWPELAAAFEKAHPGIKVSLENVGETVSNSAKFVASLAAGHGPDVLYQNRHSLSELASLGAFRAVDDLIERDGIKITDWAPVQYREMSWMGHQYGLPLETDTRFLLWNKDIFTEVGLDPDRPPRTWQDLEAMTPRLNKVAADGRFTRIAFDPYGRWGDTWFWLYAWQNRGEFFAEPEHRSATPDHLRNVAALEWLVRYYDQYLGGFANSGQLLNAGGDPFLGGRVAMVGTGNWTLNSYVVAPFAWGSAPVPYPADGLKTTWSCGYAFVMPRTVRHAAAAWEFMKWATGPGGTRIRVEYDRQRQLQQWKSRGGTGTPVVFPILTTNRQAQAMIVREYLPLIPSGMRTHFALASEALNWTRGCGSEMAPLGLVYWNAINEAATRAFNHDVTPVAALSNARRKVQPELDNFWSRLRSK